MISAEQSLPNPITLDKYAYINRTPTWRVRAIFVFGIVAWLLVLYAYWYAVLTDPFYTYFIGPLLLVITLYHLSSYILNLCYRRFDLEKHNALTATFWAAQHEPSVDVFLPICNEDTAILENTWCHVAKLRYTNIKVHVLDDSSECTQNQQLALKFGFNHIERPNKGEMKKAGNMKYAFGLTSGELIAVLDSDFAPHEDFLRETVPYMSDERVGILQTPQYFPTTKEVHRHAPIAYGAARSQEIFYRIVQVARDRLGGAHCCGTCALYRRAALASIGGFVQMAHSEDAHTGFGVTSAGWVVRYIPVILAVGICPDNPYAFFHQQHRWCLGNVVMILDRKFWQAKLSLRVKFCYLTGFLYNINFLVAILLSSQLFWVLFVYNPYIRLSYATAFYPYLAFSLFCLFLLPLSRFRLGCLQSDFLKIYSNLHAMGSIVFKKPVGWIPTNARHTRISSAFREATVIVGAYLFIYMIFLAIALRQHLVHLLDYNYYSVEFWIFYNGLLTAFLLWQLYRTLERTEIQRVADGDLSASALTLWQIRTGVGYVALLTLTFMCIVYL
jgi:cellulose synthase (UDP-forming)